MTDPSLVGESADAPVSDDSDDGVITTAEPVAAESPPAAGKPSAEVKGISVPDLLALLKARKELRGLTREGAAARFGRLVPGFEEKSRDDERWIFEGSNDRGFVRVVTLTFLPTATDNWVFGAVAVRLSTDDPRRTFDEIRRNANATLKKPKWLDLNTRDRTAWSLGENWELVAAVLEDGDVQVRSGRPARP